MSVLLPLAAELPVTETAVAVLVLGIGITIAWLLAFFR